MLLSSSAFILYEKLFILSHFEFDKQIKILLKISVAFLLSGYSIVNLILLNNFPTCSLITKKKLSSLFFLKILTSLKKIQSAFELQQSWRVLCC